MCKVKFTRKDYDKFCPSDDDCLDKIFQSKYKDAKHCHKCGNKFSYYKLRKLKLYSCAYCANQIAPTAGTIFHKSSTPLKDWFFAIYLFSLSKNGVSAKELERQLGVTYKTAWRIANRVRTLFHDNVNPLENIVEVDETYYGAKESNKHKNKKVKGTQGRSSKVKTPVIGAVERKGKIIAEVASDTTTQTIKP